MDKWDPVSGVVKIPGFLAFQVNSVYTAQRHRAIANT